MMLEMFKFLLLLSIAVPCHWLCSWVDYGSSKNRSTTKIMVIASPLSTTSASARRKINNGHWMQKQQQQQNEEEAKDDDKVVTMKMIAYVSCMNNQTTTTTTTTPLVSAHKQSDFPSLRNDRSKNKEEHGFVEQKGGKYSSSPCQVVLIQEEKNNKSHDQHNEENVFIMNPGKKGGFTINLEKKEINRETIPLNQTCSTVKEALLAMSLADAHFKEQQQKQKQITRINEGFIKIMPGSICQDHDNLNIGADSINGSSLPSLFPVSIEGMGASPTDVIFDCRAVNRTTIHENETLKNNDDDNDENDDNSKQADRAFIMSPNGIHRIANLSIRNCKQLPQTSPSLSLLKLLSKVVDNEDGSLSYQGFGGAVLALLQKPEHVNSTDTTTTTGGAGITIENVVFKNNQALIDGGAIAAVITNNAAANTATLEEKGKEPPFILLNCQFEENHAFRAGGALHVHFHSSSNHSQSTMHKNNMKQKQQQQQQQYALHMENCTYTNNRARVHGGAISFVATTTSTSSTKKTTTENVTNGVTTNNFVKKCTFRHNLAQAGGAVHTMISTTGAATHPPSSDAGQKTMSSSTSTNNHPSSSIPSLWNGVFQECTFKENLARWRGGAVYLHSSSSSSSKKKSYHTIATAAKMSFHTSIFTNNVAAGNSSSSICNTDLGDTAADEHDENKNYKDGDDDDDDNEYYDSSCLEAEEGGAGGGLYVEDAELGLYGCQFDSNQALDLSGYESLVANGARGGAIAMMWTIPFIPPFSFRQEAGLTSLNTNFSSNSAVAGNTFERPAQGGAVWIEVSGGPGKSHQQLRRTTKESPEFEKVDLRSEKMHGGESLVIAQFTNGLFHSNKATSEARMISSSKFLRKMTTSDNPISNKGGGVCINFSRRAEYHFSKGNSYQRAVEFVSTTFQKNAADLGGLGGGLYVDGGWYGYVFLLNSTFALNAAISTPYFPGAGGGIAIIDGGRFSIKGCNFTQNYASPHVNIDHHWLGGESTPKRTRIGTKEAKNLKTTSKFWETLAGYADEAAFLLSNDILEPNERPLLRWSPDPDSLSGEGGAIHLDYASSESLIESTLFHQNFCGSGDGGIDSGPKGGAVNIMFASNEHQPTTECLTFEDVHFSKNAAIASTNAMSSQMIFLDGSSSGRGGAVHINHAAPCFSKCLFDSNAATAGRGERPALGGAVDLFLSSGNVPFKQCLFVHNSVAKPHKKNKVHGKHEMDRISGSSRGEEMYEADKHIVNGGYLSMETGRGGAVSVIGSSISMNNCTIANNTAFQSMNSPVPSIGGGVYLDASSTGDLLYTSFQGNKASGLGDDVCSIDFGHEDKNPAAFTSANSNVTLSIISCEFENEPLGRRTSQENKAEKKGHYSILLLGGDTILGNPNTSVFLSGSGGNIDSLIDNEELSGEGITLSAARLYVTGENKMYSEDSPSYFSLWSQNASLHFNSRSNENSKARLRSLVMINSDLSSRVEAIVVEENAMFTNVTLGSHEDLNVSEFEVLGKVEIGGPTTKAHVDLMDNMSTMNGKISGESGGQFDLFNIKMKVSGVLKSNGVSFSLHGNETAITIAEGGTMNLAASTLFQRSKPTSLLDNAMIMNNGVILHQECGSFLTVVGGVLKQGNTGVRIITLCNATKWPGPVWNISSIAGSVAKFAGSTKVIFLDKGAVHEASTWKLTHLETTNSMSSKMIRESQLFSNTSIQMPDGVHARITVNQADARSWKEVLTIPVGGIACAKEIEYAEGVTDEQSQCQICIRSGAGCAWDNHFHSCVVSNSLKAGLNSDIHRFSTENCCPLSCNERGHCDIIEGAPTCSCDWFFTGKSCDSISPVGTISLVAASVAISLFVSIITCFLLNRRSRSQAVHNTLEQLRQGLLESVDIEYTDSNEEYTNSVRSEGLSQDYIKNLHEQLLLKDASVPMQEIQIDEDAIIGKGAFGLVYKGLWRGSAVAIKMVRHEVVVGMGEESLENFKREAFIMSRLRHPNIALLMGICLPPSIDSLDSQHLYILTEYMNMGSLADVLAAVRQKQGEQMDLDVLNDDERRVMSRILQELEATEWNYELILTCACQAARGMTYLHSRYPPVCHRDLKASNLLVDNKWTVKVADFGLSRIMTDINAPVTNQQSGLLIEHDDEEDTFSMELPMTSNMGTVAWAAPEMLAKEPKTNYGLQVDIYSFGMVLWELFECKQPFSEMLSRFDIMDAVRKGRRPHISSSCPELYKDLITKCVSQDPKMRPTFSFIVNRLQRELERLNESKIKT